MIKVIAVGKIKTSEIKALCDDYIKKIGHYHRVEIIEVKDEPITGNDSDEHIKDKEGERILAKINDQDYVVCLDLRGKMTDSLSFADFIDRTLAFKNIAFVIGGSLGLAKPVLERADARLKLSDMTFLHQMARLIILEQIYRAFKILHNETYHK